VTGYDTAKRGRLLARRSDETEFPAGVGRCRAFMEVVERAAQLAPIPRPVLIRGERGTGKELLARYIHDVGGGERPYVIVNCAAFQPDLFAATMFGHERGAFTGATERHVGLVERGNGGTLFLDEVANMARGVQEKLLRVIEYQSFERLGGSPPIEVKVRVIAATNAPLEEMMEDGDFLRDLYDRLSFAEIRIPPLRKRREDIPLLIEHFLDALHAEIPGVPRGRFTPEAIAELAAYHWPGNVRQLRHVVERLYLSDEDRVIEAAELRAELREKPETAGSFDEKVAAFERSLLLEGLAHADGNQRRAAELLGMTYDQFRHYYRKHRLAERGA
jgi:psp operon transcriptional activator